MLKQFNKPIYSLIALSLLCGLLWRMEVEWHGWRSLAWISYFHWAVPVGFGSFLLWANTQLWMTVNQRRWVNLAALTYGVILYYVLGTSLTYIFRPVFMPTSEWIYLCWQYSIFITVPFMPVGTYYILYFLGKKAHLKFLVWACFGMMLSVPVSILLLEVSSHKGGANVIHTLKSGVIIPFWIFSNGLIILGARQKQVTAHKK